MSVFWRIRNARLFIAGLLSCTVLVRYCLVVKLRRLISHTSVYPTRPKAGWEVGPLNWIQEHKCVWDGPASKATNHAPDPRAIGPCRCRATGQCLGELANWNRRPLRSSACVTRGTFSKSAILHHFPNSYTLRVEIFRMFFIHSCLRMNPMNH